MRISSSLVAFALYLSFAAAAAIPPRGVDDVVIEGMYLKLLPGEAGTTSSHWKRWHRGSR